MKTTTRIGVFMALGMVLVIGICLAYVFWQTNSLVVAQVRDKAFFLIKTFEAQMDTGYGKESGGINSFYQKDLKEIQASIPAVTEINLYQVSESPTVVASTEDAQLGKGADPEDVAAAHTDTAVVLFGSEADQGFIDITAPLHSAQGIGYVIGVKLSVQQDWDSVRDLLVQTIVIGAAGILVALLVILLVLGQMRRVLGGEPEGLVTLVDRVATGQFAGAQGGHRSTGIRLSLETMSAALEKTSRQIGELASGDFRVEVTARSDQDTLAHALQKLAEQLSQTLDQVRQAMDQVLAGADQVGLASQTLSHSTTQQAASLEQISASITDLGQQTRSNAEQALRSKRLADQALTGVKAGTEKMADLVLAIRAMEAASVKIQGVVKTIDDIAFQTNLLALNANVEAGRAGVAGRGFGVVAGEVRNLSLRSSQAVKETSALVKDCLTTIQQGVRLVVEVEAHLASIGGQAAEVAKVVGAIAEANSGQAAGLTQIEQSLALIDRSTQANAATSEQTASSAQVLTSQARGVQQMLTQFHLRTGVS